MILKHSMNSVLRTPKKSLLFLFLLAVLTIFLCIGAGMYESACNMQKDADKIFTSIVELNYLGDPENNEAAFYKNMNSELAGFDFDRVENRSEVKAVDKENTVWGYIDDSTPKRIDSALYGYGLMKVENIIPYSDELCMGVVNEILFGDQVRKDAYIMISKVDAQGNPLNYEYDQEHEYLFIGKVARGRTPTLIISPGVADIVEDIPAVTDLTENPDFFDTKEGDRIRKLQQSMAVVDDSFEITAISGLEASEPYYYNEILITEGRIFEPSEYQDGQNEVILISDYMAETYHLKAGDLLNLKLHYEKDGLGHSDYLTTPEFAHEASYLIVGTFQTKTANKYLIYMPSAAWIRQDMHSTVLARYIVDNGTGEDFIKANDDLMLENMTMTLFDQGYSESVKPILAMKNSAFLVIVLSSLSGIAILVLFAYLYVIKQKDTLKIMLSLGTGRKRAMQYILSGSAALILTASTVGALATRSFLNRIASVIYDNMKNTFGSDIRYSERKIGLQVNFEPQIRISSWLPIAVVAILIVVGILVLYAFASYILQENKIDYFKKDSKKGKLTAPGKKEEARMMLGPVRPVALKFALLSILRSLGRSVIVPFVSLILSIFIVFLGLLSNLQQEKLDAVYDQIPVSAYLTSYKNESRIVGGLDLEKDIYPIIIHGASLENALSNNKEEKRYLLTDSSEYIDQMSLYTAINYEYMGIAVTKEGTAVTGVPEQPTIRKHNNAFGYDWFLDQIRHMPKLAYADDILYTPEYFDNSGPEIEYLEGYDSGDLLRNNQVALISDSFAKENRICNGDTIRLTGWLENWENAFCCVIDVKVIGIYDAKWQTDTIYLPYMSGYSHKFYQDTNYLDPKYSLWDDYIPRNVKAVTFTLKNTRQLSMFRDYLEENGYSQVGLVNRNRKVIVIQDKNLEETIQNLTNHIRLINNLKPVLLILFGLIGFAISYLLIRHRVGELAIMRSMGAKKRQSFLSFFLEQLILFVLGLLPVLLYTILNISDFRLYGISLLYFILSYLTGTAAALLILNRTNIPDILFTKE